jgi:O-antigen/teichoic acid export membrane protein
VAGALTTTHTTRRSGVTRNLRHALLTWALPLMGALVTTPLVVRLLGTEAYGLYVLVLGLGGQVLGLSLGRALTRHVAEAHARGDVRRLGALVSAALSLAGGLALLGALALALASAWLGRALHLEGALQTQARQALLLTALAFPVAAWMQVLGALPQALQRYEWTSRVTGALALGLALANVVLAARGHGVVALVAANLVATALACLVFGLMMSRLLPQVRLSWRVERAALRDLTRFSAAVVVHQACGLLLLLWERLSLTRALGPTALTHYAVPMSLAVQFHAAVTSATGLLVPLSSAAIATTDLPRLRALYERGLRFTLAFAVLFFVGALAAGHGFLALWMGAPFADQAARALVFQAATFALLALGTVPWHVAEALERPGWNATFTLTWLLVAGTLMLLMTPAWGLNGTAAARLLGLVGLPVLVARVERAVFGAPQAALWLDLLLRLMLPSVALYAWLRALLWLAPNALTGLVLAAVLAPPIFVAALWLTGYLSARDFTGLRPSDGAVAGLGSGPEGKKRP